MMGPGWGMGGWGMGGFGTILVWIALILAIVWLARALGRGGAAPKEDRALAALRERYARGEIDSEEFERRRRDLGAGPPRGSQP